MIFTPITFKLGQVFSYLGTTLLKYKSLPTFIGCTPAVNEWWSWQREELLQEFKDKDLIVCGDGQCNSPGHTAKNLCYFLIKLLSGYTLEFEEICTTVTEVMSHNQEIFLASI